MVTAWYMPMLVASRIPWSRIWPLNFAETKTKTTIFLLKVRTTMIKYSMWEIICSAPSFFLLESHTEELFVLLHPRHTDDTVSIRRFVSFTFTPSNDRVLCFHAPSGYNTRKQLTGVRFFEGLQNYTENKNKGIENKIMLRDFNCTMDKKMDRDGRNIT